MRVQYLIAIEKILASNLHLLELFQIRRRTKKNSDKQIFPLELKVKDRTASFNGRRGI